MNANMVLAYHVIFTAYGFWLPNDPRGSWSDFVGAWELVRFGPATKTATRRSVANAPHDVSLRLTAKEALLRPPVHFSGLQARAIGRGFQTACAEGNYEITACSILPDHVHLMIVRHEQRDIETIVSHLKARATRALVIENLHPFDAQTDRRGNRSTVWSQSFWRVYLNSQSDIARSVRYVYNNPIKEGLPTQSWNFCLAAALGPRAGNAAQGPRLNI